MSTVSNKITKKINIKRSQVKKPTSFYLRVLSRHPSTSGLRNKLLISKFKAVYRHGSTTSGDFEYEINSVDSVKNSADKLLMKQCFDKAEVRHAPWFHLKNIGAVSDWNEFINKLEFGKDKNSFLIIKNRWGSRGTGNYVIKTQEELGKFLKEKSKSLSNYIVEEYKNYSVEYRIHATENEYFYACRKVLKKDTPKEQRYQRHDDNCSWLIETNKDFNKPSNWDEIVNDCKKAVTAMGADILAFDVKCTSIKDSKDKKCRFILIESCSAPSFGEITLQKYTEILPKIIKSKYGI